jgi:acyl-CoA dehydrogenase
MTQDMLALLGDQAALLFERHCTKEVLDAAEAGRWPAELWAAIEAAGLPDVLVPEADGGIGASLAEAVAILRAAGAAAAPVPLAETTLARCLLAKPGPGTLSVGFSGGAPATGRAPVGDPRVGIEIGWASVADQCVLVEEDTAGLRIVEPNGMSVTRTRRNLAGEPREFVVVAASEAAGTAPSVGVPPLALFALLRAAQMSGALSRVISVASDYSKERTQFGRAIAQFQAIQQMLAEAAGHVAAATMAVDVAALSPGEVTCAAAKIRAGEAAGRVCAIAHQIIGALGYTREYKLHALTRRLWSWRDEAGDEMFWQARLGALAIKGGASDDVWAYVTALTGG